MKFIIIWTMDIFDEDFGEDIEFTTHEYFRSDNEAADRFEELERSDEALTIKMVEVLKEYNFEGPKI